MDYDSKYHTVSRQTIKENQQSQLIRVTVNTKTLNLTTHMSHSQWMSENFQVVSAEF